MVKKFDDGLNILMYGDISKLKSTMNGHFFDQLSLASDKITQKPQTINELNCYIMDGKYTHILIPDENFHKLKGNLEECLVPTIELLGDHWVPWAIDKKRKYIIENNIKNIIVFTDRFLEDYEDISKSCAIGVGYDKNIFIDQGKNKDIDILIHGSLGEDTYKWVYPVRNYLAKILPEIGMKEGISVETWKHPGYWPEENNSNREFVKSYSNILNRAKIAIGGSSHWKLALKKFYEVPACGSILLSDLPIDDSEFFKDRIIEVDPKKISSSGYEDEIRRKVMNVLENYEKSKNILQPFKTEQDRFDKSYEGRALEIRKSISQIK
jgi:hypothetical protein